MHFVEFSNYNRYRHNCDFKGKIEYKYCKIGLFIFYDMIKSTIECTDNVSLRFKKISFCKIYNIKTHYILQFILSRDTFYRSKIFGKK